MRLTILVLIGAMLVSCNQLIGTKAAKAPGAPPVEEGQPIETTENGVIIPPSQPVKSYSGAGG
ncbi:MAG: hypothetical protein HY537_00295 [Deltaproteobacteria bacterium]|nr:hypothetical protein [Deltaproteobacteria bacterium]